MSSLLVLLALLSVATLAARRGVIGEILGGGSTLVPVAFGVAVGPGGLGFLAPSVVSGLAPAVAVGVCLLGLIAGLRAGAPIAHERPDRRTVLPLLELGLIFVALRFGGPLVGVELDAAMLLPGALLAAACLGAPGSTGSEARFAKIVALALAATALGLFAPPALAAVLVFGVVGAVVVLLLGGHGAGPVFVAVLGAITLIAGASLARGVPGVLAGVVAGAVVSRSRAGSALSPLAERAERPLLLVVAVMIAASITVDLSSALAGAALALLALGAAVATLGPARALRGDGLSSSSLALALVASLTATGVGAALLAPLVVAVALIDALALAARLASRVRRI